MNPAGLLAQDTRRIARLAWPVFVGQLSVVLFSVVDTLLVARHSTADLAALAVGSATYLTVFIGLMGVVLGLSPIVGQLFGAGRRADAGRSAQQAVWLALLLAVPGSLLLAFPAPILALARMDPAVEPKVRAYLLVLAFSLPASLLFTVFRAFNTAVSRPVVVMALQLGALVLKVPLSLALLSGVPALGLPALGVVGCALGTALCMWMQVLAAGVVVATDSFYDPFRPSRPGLSRPDRATLAALLRLGGPIGMATLIEVSGFTMMAIFIARLGTESVAAHQIAANLVGISFMVPLALANATSTLVAQRIGAQDFADAERLGWNGLRLGCTVAAVAGLAILAGREAMVALYTRDPAVAAVAVVLLGWLALFHLFDAAQTVAAFILRAWHVATGPMLIYVAALWGVGLGGGYLLAFAGWTTIPQAVRGAAGYWAAASGGLCLASLALVWLLRRVMRVKRAERIGAAQSA